jgi:hypothetical protein
MKYYLFQIMYDRFPQAWRAMVNNCVAAQDYFSGIPWYLVNIQELEQLQKGDIVVAAFTKYRYAGYGTLASNIRDIMPAAGDSFYGITSGGFPQRFDCKWVVIPLEKSQPFIDCSDLSKKYSIGLKHLHCLKEIDHSTFAVLQRRLEQAGAREVCSQSSK